MFAFLTTQRPIVPLQPLLLQCLELLLLALPHLNAVKGPLIHFRLLHPLLCPGGDPGDTKKHRLTT